MSQRRTLAFNALDSKAFGQSQAGHQKCAAAADRFVETIGHRIFLRTICPERYFQMHSSLFARFSLIKLQIDYSSLNSICSIADDLEEHGGASLIEAEITDSGYRPRTRLSAPPRDAATIPPATAFKGLSALHNKHPLCDSPLAGHVPAKSRGCGSRGVVTDIRILIR